MPGRAFPSTLRVADLDALIFPNDLQVLTDAIVPHTVPTRHRSGTPSFSYREVWSHAQDGSVSGGQDQRRTVRVAPIPAIGTGCAANVSTTTGNAVSCPPAISLRKRKRPITGAWNFSCSAVPVADPVPPVVIQRKDFMFFRRLWNFLGGRNLAMGPGNGQLPPVLPRRGHRSQ
jgi:hypothetical protein